MILIEKRPITLQFEVLVEAELVHFLHQNDAFFIDCP